MLAQSEVNITPRVGINTAEVLKLPRPHDGLLAAVRLYAVLLFVTVYPRGKLFFLGCLIVATWQQFPYLYCQRHLMF